MKRIIICLCLFVGVVRSAYAQSPVSSSGLVGTWDQEGGKHPPTMIFVDSASVKFSYKGHTGASKKYPYLINYANTPSIITVYKKANRHRIRNEYLVQAIDSDTIKLQVIKKNDSRDHFAEGQKNRVVTLVRRKVG
jgi:hypothetical protein